MIQFKPGDIIKHKDVTQWDWHLAKTLADAKIWIMFKYIYCGKGLSNIMVFICQDEYDEYCYVQALYEGQPVYLRIFPEHFSAGYFKLIGHVKI